MTITIDATVAGASANSYILLADADAYFATRLGATKWNDAAPEIKKAALITAARRINAEIYRGTRVSSTQTLAFPRTGIYNGGVAIDPSSNPSFVIEAQCEEALALLTAAGADGDVDPHAATGLEAFKALGVGDIRLDLRDPTPDDPSRTLASAEAYRLLRPYLLTQLINATVQGPRNVRLLRG